MNAARSLEDRVVVIAGASSGMGRATALQAADAGARLVLSSRNEEALRGVTSAAGDRGADAIAFPADATDPGAAAALVAATLGRHGRIDALVVTVGTNIRERRLDQLTPSSWNSMIETNLTAAFHLTKAAVPAMRKQGGGLIIYISSSAARKPDLSGAAYQASKAGVLALSHAVAEEERGNGIRTSVILPGFTHTDFVNQRPTPPTPEMLANALQAEDVASAVLFVLSLPPRASVPELQLYPSRQ